MTERGGSPGHSDRGSSLAPGERDTQRSQDAGSETSYGEPVPRTQPARPATSVPPLIPRQSPVQPISQSRRSTKIRSGRTSTHSGGNASGSDKSTESCGRCTLKRGWVRKPGDMGILWPLLDPKYREKLSRSDFSSSPAKSTSKKTQKSSHSSKTETPSPPKPSLAMFLRGGATASKTRKPHKKANKRK